MSSPNDMGDIGYTFLPGLGIYIQLYTDLFPQTKHYPKIP